MSMKIILPSRLVFWRSIFALTSLLAFLSVVQVLGSAEKLGVDLSVSAAWRGLTLVLGLIGTASLLLLALTWSSTRDRILSLAEFPERFPNNTAWIGILPVWKPPPGLCPRHLPPCPRSRTQDEGETSLFERPLPLGIAPRSQLARHPALCGRAQEARNFVSGKARFDLWLRRAV